MANKTNCIPASSSVANAQVEGFTHKVRLAHTQLCTLVRRVDAFLYKVVCLLKDGVRLLLELGCRMWRGM